MYSIYAMHKVVLLVYRCIKYIAVYHICRSGSACPSAGVSWWADESDPENKYTAEGAEDNGRSKT